MATKWVLPVVATVCVVDLIWSISPMALLYLSCFLAGSVAVLAWLTHHLPAYHSTTTHPSVGIPAVLERCCSESTVSGKQDTRITGSSAIDQQLQKAMSFIIRDYVESWYQKHVNLDSDFIAQTRLSAQSALRVLAAQCKSADWLDLLTLQLTDELIQHFRVYRQACDRLAEMDIGDDGSSSPMEGEELDLVFFDLESGLTHSKVMGKLCGDEEREKAYLDAITEMLLYIVLSEEDFHNTALRYLLRDVLSVQVLQPLVNTLCEPDFINRLFISYLKDYALSSESFQAAIRTCTNADELQELEQFTEEEIAKIRRTGSSEEDHQQLTSTQFILQMLQKAKEKLEQATEAGVEEGVPADCISPTFSDDELRRTGLPMLLRAEITDHSVAESDSSAPSAPPPVLYHLKVSCRHSGGQTEDWARQRSAEDFELLHSIVEHQTGPGLVSLPKLKEADCSDAVKQEQYCRLLEGFLSRLLFPDLLVEHPDLLGTMITFLTAEYYSLVQAPPPTQTVQQLRDRSDSAGSTGSREHTGNQSSSASTQASQPPSDLKKDPVEKLKQQSGAGGGAAGGRRSPMLGRQKSSRSADDGGSSSSGEEGITALRFDENDDSVPLRVLMVLADEIFDLKKQDQWFRRSFTVTIQQLIRATFGDKLSYKIVNYMNGMTSSEQIAEYLESAINRVWPDGRPSGMKAANRDNAMQLRTKMVARAKLLGSIPDDLRRIIGTNTSHVGMARVFEMFQHKTLNRRLVYCLLEQLIVTVFPENMQLTDTLRTLRGA